MRLLIEKTKKNLISFLVCRLHRSNFDQIFHIFCIRVSYSLNMPSSTTSSRAFILIEHEIDLSRSLLTMITSSSKRQRIAYSLYQKICLGF